MTRSLLLVLSRMLLAADDARKSVELFSGEVQCDSASLIFNLRDIVNTQDNSLGQFVVILILYICFTRLFCFSLLYIYIYSLFLLVLFSICMPDFARFRLNRLNGTRPLLRKMIRSDLIISHREKRKASHYCYTRTRLRAAITLRFRVFDQQSKGAVC